jgi:hypothetical protein
VYVFGHEGDLLLDLRRHVEAIEERSERRIGHHAFVEPDDCSFDRRFPAEALEQRGARDFGLHERDHRPMQRERQLAGGRHRLSICSGWMTVFT